MRAALIGVLCMGLAGCQSTSQGQTSDAAPGSSTGTAVAVSGIHEEYDWVKANRPGWEPVQQALIVEGKTYYDMLMLKKGSKTQPVYFKLTNGLGLF